MEQRGLRASVTFGRGDGQVRLRWEAWHDGRWEALAVQCEVCDPPSLKRLPAAVAEVLELWLSVGDTILLEMQENDHLP
jgi:hypothetical protein